MPTKISNATLSDLIGRIYDCAIDPGNWHETLAEISRTVGCANASLTLQAIPSGRTVLAVSAGVSPAQQESMKDYGPEVIELWGGFEKITSYPMDRPAVLSWERPREQWMSNRYVVEWALPQGLVDVIAVPVAHDATAYGAIGMGRHISAGPVTARDMDLLRLLIPHLQRAVSISRLLDIKTIEAKTFTSALDVLAVGVLLVDRSLRIVHANKAAETMLQTGDPVTADRGRLTLRWGPAQQALAAAVLQASDDEAEIGRRGFGIPAKRASGDAAVLHVLPLSQRSLRPGLLPSAKAAIFVAPGATSHPAPEQALAALFDLTPAEAKVLTMIGAAKTVAATATALGVGQGTVRTHLLRLFAKTGTRRQAELVKLAASLGLSA